MDVLTKRPAAANEAAPRETLHSRSGHVLLPLAIGLVAGLGLLAFYLGTITLVQDWEHALSQLREDLWFIVAIATGFGMQVGLFFHLRAMHARAKGAGMAASTGTSVTAMLACCAHHLTDVLPVLGLSGAAIFLDAYKTPLLWLGLLTNLLGIAYLLRQLTKLHSDLAFRFRSIAE